MFCLPTLALLRSGVVVDGWNMEGADVPERLTLRETSEYLRIPEKSLRWWRCIGTTGPASYLLGGRVFYDVAELDRWIAEQKQATVRGGQ